MKSLLVAALLSSALLLNTPDPSNDDTNDEDGDQQQQQQQDTAPTFDELAKSGAGLLDGEGRFGDAMAFRNLVHGPETLDDPEDPDVAETLSSLLETIKSTGPRGEKIVGDLLQAVADDKAERDRVAQEEATKLAEKLAGDAEAERRASETPEEKAARVALEQQEALTSQVQGEVTEVRTKLADVRRTPGGDGQYEEKVAKVEEFLAPADALAALLSAPNVNPAKKADAWEAADPITRERARQFFGVAGVFHVDVESDSYRKRVEAANAERKVSK